jgi:hypothetical protein
MHGKEKRLELSVLWDGIEVGECCRVMSTATSGAIGSLAIDDTEDALPLLEKGGYEGGVRCGECLIERADQESCGPTVWAENLR